jgi:hypothetical protein
MNPIPMVRSITATKEYLEVMKDIPIIDIIGTNIPLTKITIMILILIYIEY